MSSAQCARLSGLISIYSRSSSRLGFFGQSEVQIIGGKYFNFYRRDGTLRSLGSSPRPYPTLSLSNQCLTWDLNSEICRARAIIKPTLA